jgi:O-antigen/teichoic acid export membrane protein
MVFPAGLVTAAFLTRHLGAADYGRLSLLYAVLAPVVWIASTTFAGRLGVALLSEREKWSGTAAALLRANLAIGVVVAVGFGLAAEPIARAVGVPDLASLLWLGGVEIALAPVTRIHRDALIARGDYSWPAFATAAFQLTRLALVLSLVAAGWSLQGVILANLGARMVEGAVCLSRLRLPLGGASRGWFGPIRSQAWSLLGYALCLQLFNRADLLMLGLLDAPADDLGRYGAAQNLAQVPGLLALVLSPLIVSALRHHELSGHAGGVASLRDRSTRLAIAAWAFAGPVAGGAARLAALLFGEAYRPAGPMLGLLGIGAGGGLALSVLSAHQVAARRYATPLRAVIPMLIVALGLQAILIPRYGGIGAAWATAAGGVLAALIAQTFDRRAALPARGLDLARMIGGGAAGYLTTDLVGRAGLPAPFDIVAGFLVTAAALLALGLISKAEVEALVAQLRNRPPIGEPS